jgi:hypothetical protein
MAGETSLFGGDIEGLGNRVWRYNAKGVVIAI